MGILFSFLTPTYYRESFPPAPEWTPDSMPDLSGKVVIVTGGNSGIGRKAVKYLLKKNAKVYIASRNEERVRRAISELRDETGREALSLQLDLSDLRCVRRAAQEFISKEPKLDLLINNGGVMGPPIDQLTAQGYDMTFGTNVLGHHYLTKLLLPPLLHAVEDAKARGEEPDARIVNVSSFSHHFHRTLAFDAFRDSKARRAMGPALLYGHSKFGGIVMAKELTRRYGDEGIVSSALNPGNIKTEITRDTPWILTKLLDMIMYPAPYGAITTLYAAVTPEAKQHNGGYFVPWARLGAPRPETEDAKLGAALWTWLEEQVATFEQSAAA